jgi:hypothetical protein
VRDFEDQTLCATAGFDELGERNFKHAKTQRFQLTVNFGTTMVHDHVLFYDNGVTCKSARFLFDNGDQSGDAVSEYFHSIGIEGIRIIDGLVPAQRTKTGVEMVKPIIGEF